MKTLCIVPCGVSKVWDKNPNAGPTAARNVYIGPFATVCRKYAEKFFPKSWCILSAKYGFLFPDDIVPGPYNVTFNKKKSEPITLNQLSSQLKRKKLNRYNAVVVLGGKNYTNRIEILYSGVLIYSPLKNLRGMGYMMQKLRRAIITENPLLINP